jgi:hypothetical protein
MSTTCIVSRDFNRAETCTAGGAEDELEAAYEVGGSWEDDDDDEDDEDEEMEQEAAEQLMEMLEELVTDQSPAFEGVLERLLEAAEAEDMEVEYVEEGLDDPENDEKIE